jgi:hypothetical protein
MSEDAGTDLLDAPAPADEVTTSPDEPETPPAPSPLPAPPEPAVQHYARAFAAICSLAAAALHLVALADHVDHHPMVGRGFLAVAVLQAVWAIMLVRTRSKLVVLAGIALQAGSILVWIVSRTKGIAWYPGLEAVEPIGWKDFTTQVFQFLAIAAATLLLVPASYFRPAADGEQHSPVPIVVMGVVAMAAVAFVYAANHGVGHHG